MASLKVKVSFTSSMFNNRRLVKLGRFYGDDLNFSSWWSSFAAKLTVYGIMDLVEDMDTDAKREISPTTLGVPSISLSIS